MTAYYLLPCSCGKKIEVDAGQSGLNVRCSCGAELTVPAMRGLSQLERASEPPAGRPVEAPASTWGARQAQLFLGVLIMLGAAAFAVFAIYDYPPRPQLAPNYRELNRQEIEQMKLSQTWELWRELRKDFSSEEELPIMELYKHVEKNARLQLILIGVIGGVGLLLVVAGLMMRRPVTS